ncbi:VOC family protein [Sulfuricurvum sp.]|uniref:VOC family protein n=1 Tax=Sulfuricurvum sp. TaxID=2025608 RepID=UPI002E3193F9|nr:VOC family protein [Sulfuricurvum sp.]HEX5330918.1 VOC family protein [Sulfuricurvum sp.]
MQNLIVNLAVREIGESIAYYRDILGFTPIMAVPEDKSSFSPELEDGKRYLFAMVQSGGVEIMLQQDESLREDVGDFFTDIGASVTFYIRVDDVDGWYETIAPKVEIIKPIETTWYGMREFYIRDVNGYVLAFAKQVV